ncbi:MAG TPA: FAD binding domain-containing protein [Nitrososphaerales archaeon]|nr:FAD binding domain-containing protein [Nitrososphaerales archaeon]
MLYELPDFEYFEPESLEEAVRLLGEFGPRAKILAGGTDLLGLMKDRISGKEMPIPKVLVNIKKVKELQVLEHLEESTFGSALTLAQILSDSKTNVWFPALAQAARSVATNQIRNMGTLGGNLCQRPWCWYFRHPAFDCFKKGGKQCYAITGDNSTYFSVYNLGTCVMAHPSDTAPALVALGGKAKIVGSSGTRVVNMSDFFLGPKNVHDNVVTPDEILVSVSVPKNLKLKSVYIKHRIRNTWDFALASVAAAAETSESGEITSLKLVLGGVAPLPLALDDISAMFIGQKYTPERTTESMRLLTKRAKPLRMNSYKVRIVRALLGRALDKVLGNS